MTQAEKLKALIQKAIDGGWAYWLHEGVAKFEVIQPVDMLECLVIFTLGSYSQQVNQQHIIFNHDFAKALWGERSLTTSHAHKLPPGRKYGDHADGTKHSSKDLERIFSEYKCERCGKPVRTLKQLEATCFTEGKTNVGWQYHLQQAVISKNPIDYMYEAVFGGDHDNN